MPARLHRRNLCLIACMLTVAGVWWIAPGEAADWPTWRHDASRSGNTEEELAATLHLQWVLELPSPRPAWPEDQGKLQFDRQYEPVLAGKSLFIASMAGDRVTSYDTETAREQWRFYTDAPVRMAPAWWKGRLYFACDDGYLYCLDAGDGSIAWRFRGGPSDRKVLGNGRLVSAWPARGAPAIHDGKVYFAASIWPFMGIFVHALDAETGEVVWTNSGSGSTYLVQQHNSPAFAGIAPQGYIAATEDRLLVSGGRSLPAAFDRRTGEFLHFNVGSRRMGSKGGGGYEVVAGKDFFLNGGKLYRMKDGVFIDSVDASILGPSTILGKYEEGIRAFRPRWIVERKRGRRGRITEKTTIRRAWSAPLDEKIQTVHIRCGPRIYCSTEDGEILAVDLPGRDRGAEISWRVQLPDRPLSMIAGDARLFVSSDRGRIYCFGKQESDAKLPPSDKIRFVRRGAEWRYLDDGSDQEAEWRQAEFDDLDWSTGAAVLGYGNDKVETRIRYGQNFRRKHITSYFRFVFDGSNLDELGNLEFRILVDDGAVVYLNGAEVSRVFMPSGEIKFDTKAVKGTDEKTYKKVELPTNSLREGSNLLAVEVHQVSANSSDVLFDLELVGTRLPPVSPSGLSQRAEWSERASTILRESGARAGHAVALGLGSGGLVEELLRQSELQVLVLEPDAAKVESFRRRMDDLGLHGTRVSALPLSLMRAELPLYFAELVVSEDVARAGLDAGEVFVRRLFHVLRPFTGAACFDMTPSQYDSFSRTVAACELDHGRLEKRSAPLAILRRLDAPTGSADWTHQYGDATNRVASSDTVVKAPLGVLWFGGPSNKGVLPRHGHGPAPHVVGGRVFIQGRDMLRATDAYTGRLLWQRTLKDIGKLYDNTSHEPGANAVGSNYVSLRDGIYCVHEKVCLRLDPATGKTLARFTLPGAEDPKKARDWGYLAASGRFLVAGSKWTDFDSPEFTIADVTGIKGYKLFLSVTYFAYMRNFEPVPYTEAIERFVLSPLEDEEEFKDEDYKEEEKEEEKVWRSRRGRTADTEWWWSRKPAEHRAYVLANLNKLILDEEMLAKISTRLYYSYGADDDGDKYFKYLDDDPERTPNDYKALVLKRKILNKTYGFPDYKKPVRGKTGSSAGKGSDRLLVLDRLSGELFWEAESKYEFRHNAIAVSDDTVYTLDSMSSEEAAYHRRRGKEANAEAAVIARDLRTGELRWRNDERVFGTWLSYSQEHDVVIQAGARGPDRTVDEAGRGIVAYRGRSGEVLWQTGRKYSGPCILVGRKLITQGYKTPGFALDLLTGEPVKVSHPISGEAVDWKYARNYGCNTAIGCPNLLTFRSAAAGYYDLLGDSGTGNLGGFRSGCTSNLIPAGGILSAPDYTRTCTCSYQNQTSLALVHLSENETWTFSAQEYDGASVRELALNFGAPGDHRGADGTLWLDYPSVGGTSPDLPVEFLPDGKPAGYPRAHVSGMSRSELSFVAASALSGSGELIVPLDVPIEFEIANEVESGTALAVKRASFSALVPAKSVPGTGEKNARSLRAGLGSRGIEATIPGYKELATKSVTVEFWVKTDRDHYFVDSRIDGEEKNQGYVIEKRKLRVRYFVTNTKGDNNSRVVTLEAREEIPKDTWVHVAFTYDAPSGVGRLYRDGKLVARYRGRSRRPLWWDDDVPDIAVAAGAKNGTQIDELRISNRALKPAEFLLSAPASDRSPSRPGHIVGYWRMDGAMSVAGARSGGEDPSYTVQFVFAELDDAVRSGQRTFDVRIEGRTVLDEFDIVREAGGPRRPVIKEFRGVRIRDALKIQLAGDEEMRPLLNGLLIRREN